LSENKRITFDDVKNEELEGAIDKLISNFNPENLKAVENICNSKVETSEG